MKTEMKRRTFVLGAASVPVAAYATHIPMAEAAIASPIQQAVVPKLLTMMSINDSNMAGCEWRWDFVLERGVDGTYIATATQLDMFAEDGDEPWELDPHLSMTNGRELCSAVQAMADEAGYYADAEFLENVAMKLDEFDQALAEEFRTEVAAVAEEMGWYD